jgi:wobble nucleotide-excising tRNase
LSFIESEETLSTISSLSADISSIKQALSGLETRFTKEEPLKMFTEYLEKEYENFGFTPPDYWSIKTSTRGQTNKRIYSLGDKRISDIFSEGERKIHALADFFAECELNKFIGVYIFDDPVNSLDEEKMEYVGDRLVKLLKDGNQVIVFTHNLVFLNILADTQQDKLHKLNRLSDQVILEPNILMDSQQELSKIQKEIDNRIMILKQTDEDSINVMELRNVYDLISGYLETYVEGKIFKNIITRYRPNIRMHSLDKMESIDNEKIKKLMSLYNQTSRKGSRHSQPIGSPVPKYPDLIKHYEELKAEFPVN